jgi:hypothetical protein
VTLQLFPHTEWSLSSSSLRDFPLLYFHMLTGVCRFWWVRVLALAEAGDWQELEKFSKTKKPAIGMEVR